MRRSWVRLEKESSKKFKFSYAERNQRLKQLPYAQRYPLLRADAPVASIGDIVRDFGHVVHTPSKEPLSSPKFEIRGRVRSVRRAGKGLMFLDIEGNEKIQVVVNHSLVPADPIEDLIRVGDSVAVVGQPWRTKAGQFSLLASAAPRILSPCLHPMLDAHTAGGPGSVLRQHNRVAELKAFADARQVLRARDCIVKSVTDFLRENDFIEVNTPVVSGQAGGAAATPFKVESDLFLRVAPELWLKRLVIGGLDRVYEIGPSFRNEGIDATHNPEFTTCEFYMAFASLDDLMALTRRLLKTVASNVASSFPEYAQFCAPLMSDDAYGVLEFVPELEKALGEPLARSLEDLRKQCETHSIPIDATDTIDKLLDKLAGHFLEPQCTGPTFIANHPEIMAPLAKSDDVNGWRLSRRFELLINGREYINAYEEENDPEKQLEKLAEQDPTVPDRSFVDALEWGLPPTGGWGLGIDRLVMLLTGSARIGQVLTFGGMNQVNRQ